MSTPAPVTNPHVRRAVIRGVVLWMPVFVLFTAIAVLDLIRGLEGSGGAWVVFAIAALIALLSGYSTLTALRDLFATPIETQGRIARKWSRTDMLVARGRYVLVRKRVFRVPALTYANMPDEGAWLSLLHYPHTNALIHWREIDPPPEAVPAPVPTATAPLPLLQPAPPEPGPPPAERPQVTPPTFSHGDKSDAP